MSHQTSSKRSPPFWLLIGAWCLCFSGTNQKPERRRPFGTGLVRHCPQGLFSPLFTFLRAIYFFRPFRLFLVPTICPWVSEDVATSSVNHFAIFPRKKGNYILFQDKIKRPLNTEHFFPEKKSKFISILAFSKGFINT